MGEVYSSEIMYLLLAGWLLTTAALISVLRYKQLRNRELRRRNKRLILTRDCVLKLLDKAAESLEDSLELSVFLHYFTEYASRSLNAQSAAFFQYDHKARTVQASAVVGVFPSLINVPQKMLNVLASSPAKLRAYLSNTKFALAETPFADALLHQHALRFDKTEVEKRVRYKVFDCWSMLIIPVLAHTHVFGVLVLANKHDRGNFSEEDLELGRSLAEMAGITINHILSFEDLQYKMMLDSQLQTAEIIQTHLLPRQLSSSDTLDIAVYYKPAYRLGGDYYDFITVDDIHQGILVADVSGKGIPAGLVMATTRSLASVLAAGERSPREVLIQLNHHLNRLIPENMFVTISYAVINRQTGEMVYARAGHEPLICCLKDRGVCALSSGDSMVVGLVDDDLFAGSIEDKTCQLAHDDVVLFYTDGVTEAHNPRDEEFSRQRLSRILETVKELPAQEALDCIVHRLDHFMEEEPLYDDITLVLVKLH